VVQSDEWRAGETGGIVTLVRICGKHRHAVERDLISLGFNGLEDLGTPKLTLWKLNSIVMASPPGTAVYHAETRAGTYSQTDQLLANMGPQPRYEQPGEVSMPAQRVDELAALPDWTIPGNKTTISLDAMPVDELLAKREQKRTELLAQLGKNDENM
jgi:hypothetical protein